MILGNSFWLWLLAAAIVPIAIHLWQRKSGKPQLFGTFRFLPDQNFAKISKVELHEIPLLLLRILLICVLVFLLADLFMLNEKPEIDSVILTETNSLNWQTQTQNGNLEIEIPSFHIDEAGWWNIIEQADADYHPDIISVNGSLAQTRFLGGRPSISAEMTWNNSETDDELIPGSWQSGTDSYSALIQRKDSLGIHHSIEEISSPEILNNSSAIVSGDTVSYVGPVRLLINPNIPNHIQNGLAYTAGYWNVPVEYTEQQEEVLCTLLAGDRQFVIQQKGNPDGTNDTIEAGSLTGVEIEIFDLDTAAVLQPGVIVKTNGKNIPVLWFSDDLNLQVNGTVPDEMSAWFYAGIGHKLIQHSLGINQFLSPDMPDEQRQVRNSQQQLAGIAERESVRSWHLILLLILWTAERLLAPRRGM